MGYALFVAYGSLVPLDFRPLPLDAAWATFQRAPLLKLGVESRADWVANGVLYVPLGILAAGWLRQRTSGSWWLDAPLAWVACAAFAVGIEFTQLFFPPRTVSLNDLIAEFIGAAVGIVAAPLVQRWVRPLRHALRRGTSAWVTRGLGLYAVAYLLLAFFPYDLLLSAAELSARLAGPNAAWWVVPQPRGGLVQVVLLMAEAALVAPLGVLLRRLRPGLSAGAPWVLGLVFGLMLELGQLLVASGVSQGASVLARAVGLGTGTRLARHANAQGMQRLRVALARHGIWLAVPYLLLVLGVNGALRGPWRGLGAAWQTWTETRFLPFYYHYYTSEAVALFSLGSVALMYLPVAAYGWARGWATRGVVIVTAALAMLVEGAKLFVAGLHPDPTNVLVAVVAALLVHRILQWRPPAPTPEVAPAPLRVDRPMHAQQADPACPSGPALALLILGVLGAEAWAWGADPMRLPMMSLLALAAALVAWRPAWALALVPLGMLALDLAPWTGRGVLDEFDALLMVVLPVAWLRAPRQVHRNTGARAELTAPMTLLGASLLASVAMAFTAGGAHDLTARPVYSTALNALFIVKGAAWAWLTVIVWRRLGVEGPARSTFAWGMVLALAWCSGWVAWERVAFGHAWDLAAPFRVSGPISAMHRGGAYLECFLVVAITCTLGLMRRAAGLSQRLLLALVVLAGCLALVVTFSRNGYGALLAALLVLAVSVMVDRRPRHAHRLVAAAAIMVALGVVGWLVVASPFARERLAGTQRDLDSRATHWVDAVGLRPEGLLVQLFGAGLGRFPDLHYWNSREERRAASATVVREGSAGFLRLGPGATLYVEQILPESWAGPASLSVQMRSTVARPQLQVTLCRKWLLTSRDCRGIDLIAEGGAPGAWQSVGQALPGNADGHGLRPPLVLSLLTPSGAASVDVRRVSLRLADGRELVANGDFERDWDRWFFTTDVDPPWHIHSLPVAVWFEQGWLGVLAWSVLALWLVGRGGGLLLQHRALAPEALAAVTGFVASGLLNTLIDSPRMLWLLLVLIWLALAERPADPVPKSGKGPGSALEASRPAA